MSDNSPSQPLITLDFITRFPHKYWISRWAKDEAYPHGFRYKILSMRPEPQGLIELLLLLEQPDGHKTVMKHLEVSPSTFDRTAHTFVTGLAEAYDLDFELLDLSAHRTSSDFDQAVAAAGWHSTEP